MPRELAPWLREHPELYRGERVPDPEFPLYLSGTGSAPPGMRPGKVTSAAEIVWSRQSRWMPPAE